MYREVIMRSSVLVFVTLASFVAGTGAAAEIKPIELLGNGGFEEVSEGLPAGWKVNNAGKLSLVDDAHGEARAARFVSVPHKWGFCAFACGGISISPKATYHLSVWARGTGRLEVAVYQSSAGGFVGTQFLKPKLTLTDAWQKLELTYRTDDTRIGSGAFAVHLYGEKVVATVDDASFTFNPEENPQVSIESARPATRNLQLLIATRDATVALWVAGEAVPLADGFAAVQINEGLIPVVARARATGPNPGVSIRVAGHPEVDGRWRVGSGEVSGWRETGFDDGKWPVAATASDGHMWSPQTDAGEACFRQVLLWNESHYGPNRCIVPPLKQWGFPQRGVETIQLALYSPLPYRLDNYEFTLELPAEFEILNKTDYPRRYVMNNPAQKVLTEAITRDGLPYTRFRIMHKGNEAKPDQTQYSMLPIRMARPFAGDACRFYIRRSARGNFTELQQHIPIRILPPVNGRRPKKMTISQYSPMGYSPLSKEHLHRRMAQDAAAGCNAYMVSFNPGWGDLWQNYMKLFHDTAAASGARLILWMNYPLNYGGTNKGHLAWYPEWIMKHPEAHGRYYGNTPKWGEVRKCPYCNTFVTGPEGAAFWEVVKREYARAREFYPRADMFWSDWEFHNVKKDGAGVHCFCERCREAFRQFAKLPQDADLSDETIMSRHRTEWLAFRDVQDGEIVGRMARTAHELGCRYMTYSWASNEGFWAACNGKLDAAFAGMPGNGVADRYMQQMLDEYAVKFRKWTGLKQIVGQRFVFFKNVKKDGWKAMVLSHDGFVHPASWKTQVLRLVAALRGGIDLQNSLEFCGGIRYYLGEATRILATYEDLFWEGERADALAVSEQIEYPDLIVLRKGTERLVLLFNEDSEARSVLLRNKDLAPGQTARVFESADAAPNAAEMRLVIPPGDLVAVHIR